MIYTLYHIATDTKMNNNGWPGYVDAAGGLLDMAIVVAIIMLALDPHAFGAGYMP